LPEKRARFTTAANLVNELVEAKQHNAVKRVLTQWLRYDVIALDEVGYVPLVSTPKWKSSNARPTAFGTSKITDCELG